VALLGFKESARISHNAKLDSTAQQIGWAASNFSLQEIDSAKCVMPNEVFVVFGDAEYLAAFVIFEKAAAGHPSTSHWRTPPNGADLSLSEISRQRDLVVVLSPNMIQGP
jgi:hypothetical protein